MSSYNYTTYMFKINFSISCSVLISTITLLVTVSCKTQKSDDSKNMRQGIDGYIYELRGNQMPMKGKPANSNKKGVKREVFIYKAASIQQTMGNAPLFDLVNTPLVLKIMSEKDGHYKASLPTGSYSVFVNEDGKLFAAETDGPGILNLITITHNTITHRNITITVNAAF
jgi:hypothetical protein